MTGAKGIDGPEPTERELREMARTARLAQIAENLREVQDGDQPELSSTELVAECHRLLPDWIAELTPEGLRITFEERPPTRRSYQEHFSFSDRLTAFLPDEQIRLETAEEQLMLRVRLTAPGSDSALLGAGLEIERYLLENDLRPTTSRGASAA